MTSTTVSAGNVETKFDKKVNREYVREGRYGTHIGTTANSVIQVNKNLNKKSIPLVAKLSGTGVSGSTTLVGAEEALSNFDFTFNPTHKRNAVLIDNEENEKSSFQLKQEARPALMNWAMELKRDEITQAFGAIDGVDYGDATAGQLDTWNTNNQDRILYGSAIGNLSAGDHTASLATIDTTNDKLDAAMITLMKRRAALASPLVRPVIIKGDEPWYIFFVGSLGFRDLQNDATIAAANREARPRVVADNPIFNGGDLVYNGVIIKEIPDMDKFTDGDGSGSAFDGVWGANSTADGLDNAGNTASRVGVGFLCGGQAVIFGMAKMPKFTRKKEDDYEFQNGVGIVMKHEIKKTFFNDKQHGMLTVFHSATADA